MVNESRRDGLSNRPSPATEDETYLVFVVGRLGVREGVVLDRVSTLQDTNFMSGELTASNATFRKVHLR